MNGQRSMSGEKRLHEFTGLSIYVKIIKMALAISGPK